MTTEEAEIKFLLKNWKKIPIVSTKLIMNKFPYLNSPWEHWNNVIDVLKKQEEHTDVQTKTNEINTNNSSELIVDHLNNSSELTDSDNLNYLNNSSELTDSDNLNYLNNSNNDLNIDTTNIKSHIIDTEKDDSYYPDYRTDISDMDSQSINSIDDIWS